MSVLVSFSYRSYSDANLLVFLDRVIEKTRDNEIYKSEQKMVNKVVDALEPFRAGVVSAQYGDLLLIQERNRLRQLLIFAADNLAKFIDLNAMREQKYILESGFNTRKEREIHDEELKTPKISSLRRGTKSGTLVGELEEFPNGAKQVCLLHSIDGGKTYQNGQYSNGKRFKLEGMPARQDVLVKAYIVGTHGRISDVSEPAMEFVL